MTEGPLGRRPPTDFFHIDKYPLRALSEAERPKGVPSAIGVNWYPEFDRPVKGRDGRWRVAHPASGSRPRGGHCVVVKPPKLNDPITWQIFYNQGNEGACVGFGESRMMSLLNRRRYAARWLYRAAQNIDEWPETPPEEGTSVRAGLDILRTAGHRRVHRGEIGEPKPAEGIAANRWATSIEDWQRAIGWEGKEEAPFLNSWGLSYPHIVYMQIRTYDRLRREDGEFSIITDK